MPPLSVIFVDMVAREIGIVCHIVFYPRNQLPDQTVSVFFFFFFLIRYNVRFPFIAQINITTDRFPGINNVNNGVLDKRTMKHFTTFPRVLRGEINSFLQFLISM